MDDNWTPSVRTAVHYYEQNLGWTAIPDAFASGTVLPIGGDSRAEVVPRCQAFRLPDQPFEPPFEEFNPFLPAAPFRAAATATHATRP